MLLTILRARRRSDGLLSRLPLRKLALFQHQWPCLELPGTWLAPQGASPPLGNVYFLRVARARQVRCFASTTYLHISACSSYPPSSKPLHSGRCSIYTLSFRSTTGILSCKKTRPFTARRFSLQTQRLQSTGGSVDPSWRKPSTLRILAELKERIKGRKRAGKHTKEQDEILLLTDGGRSTKDTNLAHETTRRRKRRRIPPSKILNDALITVNDQAWHCTRRLRKPDYSFQSPLSPKPILHGQLQRVVPLGVSRELSLQSILASYSVSASRLSNSNNLDDVLATIFTSDTTAYLVSKGYEEVDIVLWHWILSSVSSERAASRLNCAWTFAAQRIAAEKAPIPVFVFLQLLQRQDLSLRALYHLIAHAWQRLGDVAPAILFLVPTERFESTGANHASRATESSGSKPLSLLTKPNGNRYNMTEPSIMLMTVRLLRHARILWPASFLSIATLFTTYINSQMHDSSLLTRSVASRMSKLYNKVLSLLSLPCSAHPFHQVSHQQRAQFAILRATVTYRPLLVVTREGYQAVARVQLAHRKTLSEQSWADLKSASWPPWKEDKLGFDAEKGMESGLSRASHALRNMSEAGYSKQAWERAAEIYAGWDTDASPTIQTRKFIPSKLSLPVTTSCTTPSPNARDHEQTSRSIWTARVRATRTLDEAWACFLQYNKFCRRREQQVYLAMFEKIFYDAKRRDEEHRKSTKISRPFVYPGDGFEVLPRPRYSNAAIYVPIPPPTMDGFFSRLPRHGVRPTRRLLSFLFSHAHSFKFGRSLYEISFNPSPVIASFLCRRDEVMIPQVAEAMREWPEYLQAAFLRFVGKFMSPNPSWADDGRRILSTYRATACDELGLAILLRLRPRYLPAWYNVISRLTTRSRLNYPRAEVFHSLTLLQLLTLAHAMRDIGLEPDMDGIQLMCVALEASLSARRILSLQSQRQVGERCLPVEKRSEEPWLIELRDETEAASRDLLTYIKSIFENRVNIGGFNTIFWDSSNPISIQSPGAIDPLTKMPAILDMPSAASLHALVRVLGHSRDYKGILQLTRWIAQHGPELHFASNEKDRSYEMLKRVIVAIRAFLRKAWEDEVAKTEQGCPSHPKQHIGRKTLQYPEGGETFFTTSTEVTSGQFQEKDGLPQQAKEAEELIQQAMDAINLIDFEWGGWPTDEEVENYVQQGRPI